MLEPEGEKGLSFMEVAAKLHNLPRRSEVLATGKAGTVYLCHPFIVHAGVTGIAGLRKVADDNVKLDRLVTITSKHFHHLYIIPAGVIKYGNFHCSHFSWFHAEFNTERQQAFIFLLHIVNIELCVRNTCVEQCFLIGFSWLKMLW